MLNRSSHTINSNTEFDAPDKTLRNSNSSFHGDSSSRCYGHDHINFNSSAPNLGSSNGNNDNNFELITDPNELADRIIKFNHSYASSSNKLNNDGSLYQSTTSTTPPSSSRTTSGLVVQRSKSRSRSRSRSELMTPSSQDLDRKQQQRQGHTYDESLGDAAEEDYLGLMAGIKLDQSGRYDYGRRRRSASTSTSEHCSDGLRSSEIMNTSSLFSAPPTPMNSHQSLRRSSAPRSYADHTPLSPQNCDEHGRCKLHPQCQLYDQELPQGHSCPMCFAMSHYNPKLRGRNQDSHSGTAFNENSAALSLSTEDVDRNSSNMGRSKSTNQIPIDPGLYKNDDYNDISPIRGRDRTRSLNNDYNTASAYPNSLSLSATMSPHSSRSRERVRVRNKSANRTPVNPNLIEDDDIDALKMGPGRMMGRARSVEQQRHLSDDGDGERQQQSRTRSPHAKNKDADLNRSCRSSSRGKRLANALGNIREKLTTRLPSSESSSTRHRSRSRSRRTMGLSDKEQSMVETTSPHAIEKGTRGRSRDNTSSSYAGRPNQKSDFNNPFVSSKMDFDKNTGRCKKHPSVVLAKKSSFKSGSWEIIKKSGCPLCAKRGGAFELDEIEQDIDGDTKRKMDMLLRGGQGQDIGEDVSMSIAKKTDIRFRRSSSSMSRCAVSGNSTTPNQSIIDRIPEGLQFQDTNVSRMHYTTPMGMGETGWYTGEVDLERNPHGHGRMRYKTGHSYEGQWIHGYGEIHLENLNRMKSGFGTNKAAWKQR